METKLTWWNFYSHPRFWRHIITWIFFLTMMFLIIVIPTYNDPTVSLKEDFISFFSFLLSFLILVYASFYAYNTLIPQKKYLLFCIDIVLIILVTAALDTYFSTDVIRIGELTGFLANILLFPFLLFVAFGFKLAYHGTRQIFVIERLKAQQVESELKLLKSQVNPHFLFNTLNNIYSTNLEDHDKANEIILELADLLHYQLESNKKHLTLLKDEIKSLENYVALEKIRVLDCRVQLEKKGNFDSVEIVPLLLLPFVENSFKYGTGIEAGDIEIRFEIDERKHFSFFCKNKIVQKKGKVHSGGIGLQNVKKRLELMYSQKYTLNIQEENNYFIAQLNIQL